MALFHHPETYEARIADGGLAKTLLKEGWVLVDPDAPGVTGEEDD